MGACVGRGCLAVMATFAPAVAFAHVGHGTIGSGGFLDGALHPLTGVDHLVAMVAVGLWGAQLGPPALWVMPVTFPLVMAIGGFLGLIGVPLPGVTVGVAVSGVALGGAVAVALRPPLGVAAVIVAVFAILHGHTHGAAMPLSGAPLFFGAGFVVATGLLHLCGIALGSLVRWPAGAAFVRLAGVTVAAIGLYYLALYWRGGEG